MQMPMLSYPNFSQFLQLHHNQYEQKQNVPQREYPAVALDVSETSADTSHSHSCSPTPSLSPTLPVSDKMPRRKSFTIDAILGLRDNRDREPISFHSAFHPRLRVTTLPGMAKVLHSRQENSLTTANRDKSVYEASKKGGGKSKRVRTIFTPEQLERLEAEFERQQYMVGPERLYLAHTLQLTEAQVKVWFQNRRIKWRKQHLEIQQQRLAVLKQRQRDDVDESGDSDDSSTGAKFPTFNKTSFPLENNIPVSFQPDHLSTVEPYTATGTAQITNVDTK